MAKNITRLYDGILWGYLTRFADVSYKTYLNKDKSLGFVDI